MCDNPGESFMWWTLLWTWCMVVCHTLEMSEVSRSVRVIIYCRFDQKWCYHLLINIITILRSWPLISADLLPHHCPVSWEEIWTCFIIYTNCLGIGWEVSRNFYNPIITAQFTLHLQFVFWWLYCQVVRNLVGKFGFPLNAKISRNTRIEVFKVQATLEPSGKENLTQMETQEKRSL